MTFSLSFWILNPGWKLNLICGPMTAWAAQRFYLQRRWSCALYYILLYYTIPKYTRNLLGRVDFCRTRCYRCLYTDFTPCDLSKPIWLNKSLLYLARLKGIVSWDFRPVIFSPIEPTLSPESHPKAIYIRLWNNFFQSQEGFQGCLV